MPNPQYTAEELAAVNPTARVLSEVMGGAIYAEAVPGSELTAVSQPGGRAQMLATCAAFVGMFMVAVSIAGGEFDASELFEQLADDYAQGNYRLIAPDTDDRISDLAVIG